MWKNSRLIKKVALPREIISILGVLVNMEEIVTADRDAVSMMGRLQAHKQHAALTAILALALGLRVWGAGFGLPYVGYQPDEYLVADSALAMLKTENLNPREQPPYALHFYLQYAVGKILITYYDLQNTPLDLAQVSPYTDVSLEEQLQLGIGVPYPFPGFYFWGRVVVALLGTGTIWILYDLSRRVSSPRVGLLAALFLAVSPLHARESHFLTTGVPVTFFLLLAMYCVFLAYTQRKWWLYLLAVLASAAAIYTKKNGYIILVTWFSLLAISTWRGVRDKEYRQILKVSIVALGAAFAALLLSTPDVWNSITSPGVISATAAHFYTQVFGYEYVYANSHWGASGENTWWWIISRLLSTPWCYIAVISVPGLYFLVRKYRHVLWLWLLPVVYYFFVASFTNRFDRWLLPLLPFIAVQAALTVEAAIKWAYQKYGQFPGVKLGGALAIGLLVCMPFVAIAQTDYLLAQKDVRALASEWVAKNLPAGAGIVVESYGPYVPPDSHGVRYLRSATDYELEIYRKYGANYVAVSSGWYQRFFNEAERYEEQAKKYSDLLNSSAPKTVISGPFLGQSGYSITILDIRR